jgi:hypothetical protein
MRREADQMSLLEAARGAGICIRDVATEEQDLEDVFLALTTGNASDAA